MSCVSSCSEISARYNEIGSTSPFIITAIQFGERDTPMIARLDQRLRDQQLPRRRDVDDARGDVCVVTDEVCPAGLRRTPVRPHSNPERQLLELGRRLERNQHAQHGRDRAARLREEHHQSVAQLLHDARVAGQQLLDDPILRGKEPQSFFVPGGRGELGKADEIGEYHRAGG